nr:MAG TPA: hypothetical protein [Microviridae sp.]
MSEKKIPLRGFAKYSLNSDISDHSQSCRCVVTSEMLAQGVLPEPNPVGDFLFDHNADGSVTFCSDYGILFGQKAIDNMNQTQLRRYMNSLVPRSSNYTRKYNDDFLLDYCKDRNIQSATEMTSWLDYLLSEGQSLESDLQAYASSLSASVVESTQSTQSTQSAAQSSTE